MSPRATEFVPRMGSLTPPTTTASSPAVPDGSEVTGAVPAAGTVRGWHPATLNAYLAPITNYWKQATLSKFEDEEIRGELFLDRCGDEEWNITKLGLPLGPAIDLAAEVSKIVGGTSLKRTFGFNPYSMQT